jgi:hypothetical protein
MMAKCEDNSIRESLTRLMPPVKIRWLAVETGALKRRRKVDMENRRSLRHERPARLGSFLGKARRLT